MSEKFNRILPHTLKFEGGFTVDTGGPTNYGVTQSTYDNYLMKRKSQPKDVRQITYGEVKDIYMGEYYKSPKYDKLPENLSGVMFDFGVNSGPKTATTFLQNIVGTKADGIIGPKTIKAVEDYIEKNGENFLIEAVIGSRREFLQGLIDFDPMRYGPYAVGWADRLDKLTEIYTSRDVIAKE